MSAFPRLCLVSLLVVPVFEHLLNAQDATPAAATLAIEPGESISQMSIVTRPAAVRGALSWTIETKMHRGWPSGISVSPDGALVATGDYDGTVRLWEAASGKLIRVLVGHDASVYDVAFSPDGSLLASTGWQDNTARIWNVKTGMTQRILKNHKDYTNKLAWSPDGKKLVVSGGNSGFATFWDVVEFKHLRTVERGIPINGVAWSPDGKVVACATTQGAVLLDAGSGNDLGSFEVKGKNVFAVAWSPDSKFLLAGGTRSTALCDVAASKILDELNGDGRVVSWSPDGKKIVTGNGGGMQVFNGKTHFREDLRRIAATGFGWDKKTGNPVVLTPTEVFFIDFKEKSKARKFAIAEMDSLMWSPSRPVITGLQEKTLGLWDMATGKRLAEISGHTDRVSAAAWSADGKLLATGSFDTTAKVWDAKTGKLLRTLADHDQAVRAVAWSTDGKLATASEDKKARIFPANSDKPMVLEGHTHPVLAVAWSRKGNLASGGEDGDINIWDAKTAKSIGHLSLEKNILAIAFSPDGSKLGVFKSDNITDIIDVARMLKAASKPIVSQLSSEKGTAILGNLAWSPDGTLVATTDRALTLWNANTETRLHRIQMPTFVENIAFAPDGRTIVGGLGDRTVRFCDTPTGDLRGTIVHDVNQIIAIANDGHYKSVPGLEANLVFIVQTNKSQDTYDLKTFVGKYGWKNNPAAVRLMQN